MSEAEAAPGPSELQIQQAVRAAIAATERGDYIGAMKVFRVVYEDPAIKAPIDGMSFYGLCLAVEDRQTKRGVDLCRSAIGAQSYDARHYANLIRLHLKRQNRPAAIEVFEEAIARLPKDDLLSKIRKELGLRPPPPIRFLAADNLLNKMLIKRRERRKDRKYLSFGSLHPAVGFLLVVLLFAAIFGVTFTILYRQAYG